MNETVSTLRAGLEQAWVITMTALPRFVMFLVILVIGYFVAKLLANLTDRLLEKLHFDRLVERGGVKRTLGRTGWDASDIVAKIIFWAVLLFSAQLAFGVFGPNPISDLLTRVIAFLPALLVAGLILIVAAAIAAGVKEILGAALSGVSYGQWLARGASVGVLLLGLFAALSHLQIAPAIVNGLFYAILAIVAGSAIVAIGGGGIQPMRNVWERTITRVSEEAPRLRGEAEEAAAKAKKRAEELQRQGEDEFRRAA